jgi:hypothetical protein
MLGLVDCEDGFGEVLLAQLDKIRVHSRIDAFYVIPILLRQRKASKITDKSKVIQ